MLPGNVASSLAISSEFMPPDDGVTGPLIDYERGGIALNDPSQGLNVINWSCYVAANNQDVMVKPEGGSEILVFTQPGIERLSFAFDQNMRATVAYQIGANCYLRWYDSAIPGFTTTTFANVRDPRLSLDDKRPTQVALNSDIIFAYIRGEFLCYRQQRDRFLTEYVLRGFVQPNVHLRNIGMGENLRMQFELA